MDFVKYYAFLLFLCFSLSGKSQSDSIYSFYVAGHAYGAHSGTNIGLHPPFLDKLTEVRDSSVMALFLTGDIVNHSNNESWMQVEKELTELGLKSYYVMGNHDNNSIGYEVFRKKYDGDYYSFIYQNELYIVLNSTESDRSISDAQLNFLDNVFANTDASWERAFIFFHEVIWNSHIKYKQVKSNSRSRYAQLVNISNFWDEVYPKLTVLPEKKFYLFAGDVGGNLDAIAASYDNWENVTLLSSGMGEVEDENYMKVTVLPDTVLITLIPLNDEIELNPIAWYNIPEKPDTIYGPTTVFSMQADVHYEISPNFNATSYKWELSSGISGGSDSPEITLQFNNQFQEGKIVVKALNDGFGESEPAELVIIMENNTTISQNFIEEDFKIIQNRNFIQVNFNSAISQNASVKIYDVLGNTIFNEDFILSSGLNSKTINKNIGIKGLNIIELRTSAERIARKIISY